MPINPRLPTVRSNRGEHPDLNPDGTFKPDVDLPTEQRDLYRRYSDPAEAANLMQRVSAWQGRQPVETQSIVQGRVYGAGRPALEGFAEYLEAVRTQNDFVAIQNGKDVFISDDDVDGMSVDEFDQYFDANGRPKPHVHFHPSRGIRLDDGIDPNSAKELR